MKKIIALSLIISLILISLPTTTGKDETINKLNSKNLMSPFSSGYNFFDPKSIEDDSIWSNSTEGDHFPCGVEYWWLYTMLTLEDGRHWDMCAQFFYVMNWTGEEWSKTEGISYVRIQSWDRETGKYYDCFHEASHPGPFYHEKNKVNLSYYESTMEGRYPDYNAHFVDDINGFVLNVDAHAIVPPYQHLSSIVNGRIPIGTGTFAYWSIPYLLLEGNITINGTVYNVTGTGYHEHMFGDRQLNEKRIRFSSVPGILQTGFLYFSVIKWIIQSRAVSWLNKIHIPHISVDNLRGYDWIWAAFDNGWSMIFVRIRFGYPFSFSEGPAYGFLVLSDGENIYEFGGVYVKFMREVYIEENGIYVPLDMKIMGLDDEKRLNIYFESNTDFTRLYNKFTQIGQTDGGLFLAAGNVTGVFENGEEIELLKGRGTNTPFLLFPLIKYRSTHFKIKLPPDGFGFTRTRVIGQEKRTISFGLD